MATTLSVVLPCYNEEGTLRDLHRRLIASIAPLNLDYELIFIDDGSGDNTVSVLRTLKEEDSKVHWMSFSRNFGHQAALTAGLERSSGDAIVMMDADLQHPPELIPEMVQAWRTGFDIVYGIRDKTEGLSFFKANLTEIFYWIFNLISDTYLPPKAADFKLLSRRAANVLINLPERARFLRGLVHWLGFQSKGVVFMSPRRPKGKAGYTFGRRWLLAMDGFFAFSLAPLRLAFLIGSLILLFSFTLLMFVLWAWFHSGTVRGWTATMVTTLILHGGQLILLGVFGEYIGRIYNEVKRRPLYVIKDQDSLKNIPEMK